MYQNLSRLLSLLARAVVGADGVPADVLASTVSRRALVLVHEEDGRETALLNRVVWGWIYQIILKLFFKYF
jgi:hypothetical protein